MIAYRELDFCNPLSSALLDRALVKRVLLASPTTLIALLKAAAFGWSQEALSRNAEEISAFGRQLYDRVAGFAEYLAKVGSSLDAAVKGYNAAVGSFEQTLLPGAPLQTSSPNPLNPLGSRANPPSPCGKFAQIRLPRLLFYIVFTNRRQFPSVLSLPSS